MGKDLATNGPVAGSGSLTRLVRKLKKETMNDNEKAGWAAFTAERTKRFALIEGVKALRGHVIGLAIDAEQGIPIETEIELKRIALIADELSKPVLGDPCKGCGKPLQNKDNDMDKPFLDCMNSACDHHDVS